MSRQAKRTLILLLAVIPIIVSWRDRQNHLKAREFEFQYVTRVPTVPPGAAKLRLWIPVPQSDEWQEISGLRIESPVAYELHREREYGNRYAYLEVVPRREVMPIEVRMRFTAKRHEHKIEFREAGERGSGPEKNPAELIRALQPDRLVPTDGIIAALARDKIRGLERPLDKARAIYDYVVSTMRYDKSGTGWGRGDAIYACNARRGNCTDFHALFIGMMRAAGIPARFEIGFPLPPDQHAGEIPGYHCWAQFWLDSVGWVPVDASEGWKNPERRDYFFGGHDQNRVLFSRGRDIRFNPAQQGEALNYFIYPYAELNRKPFAGIRYEFSFRER